MRAIAISASLLILLGLLGLSRAQSGKGAENLGDRPDPQLCPGSVVLAPQLGAGRPEAISRPTHLTSVWSCRYEITGVGNGGQSGPGLRLISVRRVQDPGLVRRLASGINRLRPYSTRDREMHCPPETTEQFYLRFVSNNGVEQSVQLYLSGCRAAIAGRSDRWLHLSSGFEGLLREIVAPGTSSVPNARFDYPDVLFGHHLFSSEG
jgi:hypothetical protein